LSSRTLGSAASSTLPGKLPAYLICAARYDPLRRASSRASRICLRGHGSVFLDLLKSRTAPGQDQGP
jgi:hypothetical protein